MLKKYHLIAQGDDADSIGALRLLEENGMGYVLTLVDKCPEYYYFLKARYSMDALPLVFQYVGGFENYEVIGSLSALEDHLRELTE